MDEEGNEAASSFSFLNEGVVRMQSGTLWIARWTLKLLGKCSRCAVKRRHERGTARLAR